MNKAQIEDTITHHKKEISFKSFAILCLLVIIPIAYGLGLYAKEDKNLECRRDLIACRGKLLQSQIEVRRLLSQEVDYKYWFLQMDAHDRVIKIEDQKRGTKCRN